MIYRYFHVQVVIRVLLMAATLTAAVYLAIETSLYATTALLTLLAAYQVWSLLHFVDRTNLSLSRFFDSVRYGDFLSTNVSGQLGGTFKDLSSAMNKVSSAFHSARAEKEEHYRYLQTVIQHVGVGLMAYTDTGEVELFNPAAKRLLRLPQLKNLRNLEPISGEMCETLQKIQPGERALVKVQTDFEIRHFSIHATQIRLGQKLLTLVSFQNIGAELAEQEMIAWQNLIRVLTHEIMNSMTPIASLAGSVGEAVRSQMVKGDKSPEQLSVISQDISDALQTIEKRSQGLMHFVESYRDLTRIPQPDIRQIKISELFKRLDRLMESSIHQNHVEFRVSVDPPDLSVACDPDLIEQVLINLVKNSLHGLQEVLDPRLEISSRLDNENRLVMEVSDNGAGIVPGALDKIFIPFFTTKKGGTGIGLSLSRHIMRLHRGHITARSTPNERTTFKLTFN